MRGLEYPQDLEITVDGQRIFLATVGGGDDFKLLMKDVTAAGDAVDARLQVKVPVKAGPRAVGVTFLQKTPAVDSRILQPYIRSSVDTYDFTGRPHIETVTIAGPFNPTGPGDTPSRERIFSCNPKTAAEEDAPASAKASARSRRSSQEIEASEDGCATKILSTLARRAYRRPVTKTDTTRLLTPSRIGPLTNPPQVRERSARLPTTCSDFSRQSAGEPRRISPRRCG